MPQSWNPAHTLNIYRGMARSGGVEKYRRERSYLLKQAAWSRRNVGGRSVYYIVAMIGLRSGLVR